MLLKIKFHLGLSLLIESLWLTYNSASYHDCMYLLLDTIFTYNFEIGLVVTVDLFIEYPLNINLGT